MTAIINLRNKIHSIITNHGVDIKMLKDVLSPVCNYTDSFTFDANITNIINIIARDDNNKFTTKNIKLLSKDVPAITAFITSILLILNSIPSVKITYTHSESEEFMFKIIVYIFIVIMPRKICRYFTKTETLVLFNCAVLIHQVLIESEILKNAMTNVASWFKKNKFQCQCFTTKRSVIENKVSKVENNLINTLSNAIKMDKLEKSMRKIQFKTEPIII